LETLKQGQHLGQVQCKWEEQLVEPRLLAAQLFSDEK
jgi:hypothetical protein